MKAAILVFRPAKAPAAYVSDAAVRHSAADLVRLFALDRIPSMRRQLVCHWRRAEDGRLVAVWERDVVSVPHC